ncbi:hypothetical protein [Pseudomonas graminis]
MKIDNRTIRKIKPCFSYHLNKSRNLTTTTLILLGNIRKQTTVKNQLPCNETTVYTGMAWYPPVQVLIGLSVFNLTTCHDDEGPLQPARKLNTSDSEIIFQKAYHARPA